LPPLVIIYDPVSGGVWEYIVSLQSAVMCNILHQCNWVASFHEIVCAHVQNG
jgi:hypothetical protein